MALVTYLYRLDIPVMTGHMGTIAVFNPGASLSNQTTQQSILEGGTSISVFTFISQVPNLYVKTDSTNSRWANFISRLKANGGIDCIQVIAGRPHADPDFPAFKNVHSTLWHTVFHVRPSTSASADTILYIDNPDPTTYPQYTDRYPSKRCYEIDPTSFYINNNDYISCKLKNSTPIAANAVDVSIRGVNATYGKWADILEVHDMTRQEVLDLIAELALVNDTHNHDDRYSQLGHTHAGGGTGGAVTGLTLQDVLDSGEVALAAHNHDSTYFSIGDMALIQMTADSANNPLPVFNDLFDLTKYVAELQVNINSLADDLTDHLAVYASHTHPHDHDARYSLVNHNHDASYAFKDHDHDDDYEPLGNVAGSHNHDDLYSKLDHMHLGLGVAVPADHGYHYGQDGLSTDPRTLV